MKSKNNILTLRNMISAAVKNSRTATLTCLAYNKGIKPIL
jgi:hypothetical protein